MLMYLKQASPWLRFIGILGFIMCGFMVMGALPFFVRAPFVNTWGELSEIPGFEAVASNMGVVGVGFGIYLLGLAVLSFFPCYFIYNFGAKIRTYLRTGAEQDLEGALKNNKSLWKVSGILTIVILAFIPVVFIITMVAVVAAYL
jgi:hypothetical protein